MGSMYTAVLFLGIQNASGVQPSVFVERTVFYRERAAGMYSAMPYAFVQVLIELPYCFFQTLFYGVSVYVMMGFEWTVAKFFWYIFFMYFTLLYFTYYGMMCIGPNASVSTIISAAFYGVWNLFSGFLIPRLAPSAKRPQVLGEHFGGLYLLQFSHIFNQDVAANGCYSNNFPPAFQGFAYTTRSLLDDFSL